MFKCLKDLLATIRLQWRSIFGLLMIGYLSMVASSWGDIHVWVWVAFICGLHLLAGKCIYRTDTVNLLSAWWCGNVTLTLILNSISERPYMQGGGVVDIAGEMAPVLTVDYLVMAPFDLSFLCLICWLTYKNIQRLTIWSLIVCAYLVSNLWAHFNYSFALYTGTSPAVVGAEYDLFMYGSFYACLALLLVGSITDRLLQYGHINVNMDIDVRSILSRRFAAKQGV